MSDSLILLVEADQPAGDVITGVLSQVGYQLTTVTDTGEAFRQAATHQLIIIDALGTDAAAQQFCREIRATPALAPIPVLCISRTDDVEERIRFLEAGADDVIARPFDARELEARVEALLLRFKRSRDRAPVTTLDLGDPGRNRIVACFSPKGGAGTTTIAVNVATAIALRAPDRTLIVDLDLQWGQVATHLNLKTHQTIADLAQDPQAQREPDLLRSYAMRHESGLWVLAAPPSPELAELVQASAIELILATALEAFETVVVDAGSVLDERSLAALERADNIALAVYPEIAALRAVASLVEYLNRTGAVTTRTTFVLNQLFARQLVRVPQVEGSLGVKIAAELPYDPFLYLKAVNEGVPVVLGAPRTPPAERLGELATKLFGRAAAVPVERPDGRRGLLAGLLKRA
ncbi:MAG: AAA family ATPase [Chloroflexota bacterium]